MAKRSEKYHLRQAVSISKQLERLYHDCREFLDSWPPPPRAKVEEALADFHETIRGSIAVLDLLRGLDAEIPHHLLKAD